MTVSLTLHGVTAKAFDQLSRIVEHGVGAVREDDTVRIDGITARYAYDAGCQDLKVEILEHPRLVTNGYVIGWIVNSLASAGAE